MFRCVCLIFCVLAFVISCGMSVAEADGDTMILEAEAAAEQDVSKFAWFSVGMFGTPVSSAVGTIIGFAIGGAVAPQSASGFFGYGPSEAQLTGAFVGMLAGAAIPFILTYNHNPSPPVDRLVGKSPEYIERYTEAYRKKARRIRTQSAVAGCLLPGCVVALVGFIF